MAKKNYVRIDQWDVLLLLLLTGTGYVVYMTPIWINPNITLQFIINLADTIFGWLIGGFILKKVLEASLKK